MSVHAFLLLLAVSSSLAHGSDTLSNGDKRSPAQDHTVNFGDVVAFTEIGFGGMLSDKFRHVLAVASAPGAETYFMALIKGNSPENQLYGLAGLNIIQSHQYAASKDHLMQRTEKVSYGRGGCLVETMGVKDVIPHMEVLVQHRIQLRPSNDPLFLLALIVTTISLAILIYALMIILVRWMSERSRRIAVSRTGES